MNIVNSLISFFFFNDTATTEIYTLSLHDALPIYGPQSRATRRVPRGQGQAVRIFRGPGHESDRRVGLAGGRFHEDRKSTRLNSSHLVISYAVFCLEKKNISDRFFRIS